MPRASAVAVAGWWASLIAGLAPDGVAERAARWADFAASGANINGTTRTESKHGVVQAGFPARGLESRLALLDLRREMVGRRAVGGGRRAQLDLCVAHGSPQPVEQRFLQRPAELRLGEILVAIRHFRDDRGGDHRRAGLPILSAADSAHPLAPLDDAPFPEQLAR